MGTRSALSYSSVRTYLECPLRWKFLYIDQIPETPRGYFSFGRTVHTVLEEMLRPLVTPSTRLTPSGASQRTLDDWPGSRAGPAGRLPTTTEMLQLYQASWIRDGYVSTDEEERYRLLGEEILRAYHADLTRAPPTPVAVEPHLEAVWDGVAIHGYIDRIDRRPSGALEILDYKTSRELSREDAEASDQLSMYQVLVEKNFAEPVEQLTLLHLRSRTPHSVPRRDPTSLEETRERVVEAGDGIKSQSYEPSPGRHCSRCEFKSRCPEFRTVPEGDRAQLLGLVDRFQRLRSDEARLETELRATAEELHRAADRLGVHRVPGSESVAIRRREEVWRLPDAGLGALLSELGLEGQLRPDDVEGLRRMATDRATEPATRRRLREAAGRQVRWYWVLEDPGGRS